MKPEASEILRSELFAEGKYLTLTRYDWRAPDGSEHVWESADRVHRSYAVAVAARLNPSGKLVLIRQFRPPVNCVMIEFPAGLIDKGESAADAAVRELREETGYIGVVKHIYPPVMSSPGMTGERISLAVMEIDEESFENKHPKTDFDSSECIETLTVDADHTLLPFLLELQTQGTGIDAKLFSYALSVNMLHHD